VRELRKPESIVQPWVVLYRLTNGSATICMAAGGAC